LRALAFQWMPSSFLECHCECQLNEWKNKFRVGALKNYVRIWLLWMCSQWSTFNNWIKFYEKMGSFLFVINVCAHMVFFNLQTPLQFFLQLWKHCVFEIIGAAWCWSSYLHMSAWRYRVARCFCLEFWGDYFLH
jgi:hypothetical protein